MEIERVAGYGETTNIVCVELPAGMNERKALFKIEAKTASSQGFDRVPDGADLSVSLQIQVEPVAILTSLVPSIKRSRNRNHR